MALENRKGFVRTLEAIIASMIFLGLVVTVIPGTISQPEDRSTVKQSVHSSLEALDKSGELRDTLTVTAVENDLSPYIPLGYNYTVQITRTTNESRDASPGDSFHFNESGYAEIQFWVEEASITANYSGDEILSSAGKGYYRRTVEPAGWLNFSGSGKVRFDYDSYKTDGESVTKENLITVSYIIGDSEKEVAVKLWK